MHHRNKRPRTSGSRGACFCKKWIKRVIQREKVTHKGQWKPEDEEEARRQPPRRQRRVEIEYWDGRRWRTWFRKYRTEKDARRAARQLNEAHWRRIGWAFRLKEEANESHEDSHNSGREGGPEAVRP